MKMGHAAFLPTAPPRCALISKRFSHKASIFTFFFPRKPQRRYYTSPNPICLDSEWCYVMFASGHAAAPASPVWKRRRCRIRRRKCRRSCRLSGRNSAISWGRRKNSSQQRSAEYEKRRQLLSMSVFFFSLSPSLPATSTRTFSALSEQIHKPEARVRSHPQRPPTIWTFFFCVHVFSNMRWPISVLWVEMGESGCEQNRKPLPNYKQRRALSNSNILVKRSVKKIGSLWSGSRMSQTVCDWFQYTRKNKHRSPLIRLICPGSRIGIHRVCAACLNPL